MDVSVGPFVLDDESQILKMMSLYYVLGDAVWHIYIYMLMYIICFVSKLLVLHVWVFITIFVGRPQE